MTDMTDEELQRNELLRNAFTAGRDAIVQALGSHDIPKESLLDVMTLMLHNILTDGGTLDKRVSLHNAECFSELLKKMIESSQQNIQNAYAGRLM